MNVILPAELEQLVNQLIASGPYQSAEEVIRDGVFLLQEREDEQRLLAELRHEISLGVEQADQGKLAPMDAMRILAEVRQRRAAREKPDASR